ncbi:MAG: RNA 2',3'-cyclic phosphodiesterase [Anaerovoracaceae bacterium]|jgi:2'-5' RNA ligase
MTKKEKIRLFIAIRFSEKTINDLKDVMDDMRRLGVTGNFTSPGNIHLTLAFIGETDLEDQIEDALSSVPVPDIRVSFDRIGHFGNLLWIGISRDPALDSYVKAVREALDDRAVPFDHKAFKPHITLVRKARFPGDLKPHIPSGSKPARTVSLMRSDRVNGKIKYTSVADYR